jgi:hypothetical protein
MDAGVKRLCMEAATMSKSVFPPTYNVIKQTEAVAGVVPSEAVGGSDGVCASVHFSVDLANASHYDPNDACQGFAAWAEKEPGAASNWSFVCPNVMIQKDHHYYYGLVIVLFHGAALSWEGAAIRHATSMTVPGKDKDGNDNHVSGMHCCPSSRLMEAKVTGRNLKKRKRSKRKRS